MFSTLWRICFSLEANSNPQQVCAQSVHSLRPLFDRVVIRSTEGVLSQPFVSTPVSVAGQTVFRRRSGPARVGPCYSEDIYAVFDTHNFSRVPQDRASASILLYELSGPRLSRISRAAVGISVPAADDARICVDREYKTTLGWDQSGFHRRRRRHRFGRTGPRCVSSKTWRLEAIDS